MPSSTSSSRASAVWGAVWFCLGIALALEGATRVDQWWSYGAPMLGAYTYDAALLTEDEWGIRGNPGGTYEKWSLNSLGFRGPEPSNRRPRVVTTGASETFGLYEGPGLEWPRQLETVLAERHVEADVLNAAIAGMSMPAQIVHLRRRVSPLQPDVVVVMLHYASLVGVTSESIRARVAAPPRPVVRDVGGWSDALQPRLPRKLNDSLLPKLPDGITNAFDRVKTALKLWRLETQLGDRYRSDTAVTDSEQAALDELLHQLAQVGREAHFGLVLVAPPRLFDERALRFHYLAFPNVDEQWLHDALDVLTASSRATAAKLGMGFVDLNEAFAGQEPALMADMVHFNDAGARLAAESVAPSVAEVLQQRASRGRPRN